MNGELNIKSYFSQFVKKTREKRGFSQTELGERTFGAGDKYAKQRISKIESGKNVTLKTMERLLEALNCDIQFIDP